MKQPFRSRPRIRRQEEGPDNQIVDGIIAEEPQALVPTAEVVGMPPQDEPQVISPPVRPPRRRRARQVKPGLLLLSITLIVAGIFFTLLNVATLSETVVHWWPAVSLAVSLLWSLVALIRRDARAFLGGAGMAGVSISLLLDTQDVAAFHETMVGVILVTLGMAIVVRGLLLRPGHSR